MESETFAQKCPILQHWKALRSGALPARLRVARPWQPLYERYVAAIPNGWFLRGAKEGRSMRARTSPIEQELGTACLLGRDKTQMRENAKLGRGIDLDPTHRTASNARVSRPGRGLY